MAQARQALAQAEGSLAEASKHKEGMRDAIAAQDQEVMQLKHRWVFMVIWLAANASDPCNACHSALCNSRTRCALLLLRQPTHNPTLGRCHFALRAVQGSV